MPSKGRVESRNNILRPKAVNTARLNSAVVNAVRANQGHPQKEDQGYVDSGFSRHMTRNMSYLLDFKEFDGGYVTFRGGAKGGKITDKGTFKNSTTAPLEATHADFFGDKTKLDMSKITTTYLVPTTPNTRIHKDHSLDHVIGDVQSGVQTRRMTKTSNEQGFISAVYEGKTHEDLHTCLFACFLSQVEPKKKVWTLVDLPYGKRAIGTKWVYKNKKDERGIVIRNKVRLVAQGYTQEEGIDYDEVFAPVARIEAIRLFLAYASFKYFVVYQMNVKSAFLYGKLKKKFMSINLQGLKIQISPTKFIRNEMCTEFEKMMHKKFQMSSVGELTFFLGLQVTQKDDGIFISQDKYVDEILKKFGFSTVKTASQPKLGLWYPKDLPFDLEAYTDNDYAGASLDRKSIIGGCQFLGSRLISWQCKKQTIVANSTTEGEYVAAASCWEVNCAAADDAIQVSIVGLTYYCSKLENGIFFSIKQEGSEGFHQIVDFLNTSHIRYALTENPTIYVSLIQQFWQTATASTLDNGEMEITATIDGKVKIVTEASIRRHLKLEDSDGISNLPTTEIFEQLALMGYVSNSDKLTFQKGHFSPQWRFLIHTILHCLSSKKTAWEQFSSNIATAIICLATNRKFNFSKLIFDGMVKNLDSKHKILMYPRFIQVFLNKNKRLLQPHTRTYIAPTHTPKLFSNMKRVSKGYTGVDILLFPTMLVQGSIFQGEGSIVPVESHHTPTGAPSTSQPHLSPTLKSSIRQETEVPQPSSPPHTNVADEAASTGVDVRYGRAATSFTCLEAG
ncbi:copia protein [Tanacetum coccineum]